MALKIKSLYNFILLAIVIYLIFKFFIGMVFTIAKSPSILGGIFEYGKQCYYYIGLISILLLRNGYKVYLILIGLILIGNLITKKIARMELILLGIVQVVWLFFYFCYNSYVSNALFTVKATSKSATRIMVALIYEPEIIFFNLVIFLFSLGAIYIFLRYIYKFIDCFCIEAEREGINDAGEEDSNMQ